MTRKNVLSLLVFNAILNAFLINLQILHITHLNWWLVFLPVWYSLALIASKIVNDSLKQGKLMKQFVKLRNIFEEKI
jgi:hypothetical protein